MSVQTEEFAAVVARHRPADARLLRDALTLATRAHAGEFRRGGDPNVLHSIAVALIVADLGADAVVIAAALLHCVPPARAREIGQQHPWLTGDISNLVADFRRSASVLDHVDLLRLDRRAVAIRAAHRLHNMRTIEHLEPAAQPTKAHETLDLMAPAARTIGLHALAAELETLSYATLRGKLPGSARSDVPRLPSRPGRTGACLGLVHAASRLLPAICRRWWADEWTAELHVLTARRDRIRFVVGLLHGVPAMAVRARRSARRSGGDR